jgi:hypothetical protein
VSDHYEKQDLLDSNPFNFSIIYFVVHRFLSYILPRPFCFTWLFQFLCFLQQQKWVDSHCQWGNSSSRDSFFDAVRDNAVGSHKAVHVHSLQMFQNVLQKQMFTSGLMGNFKMSKGIATTPKTAGYLMS